MSTTTPSPANNQTAVKRFQEETVNKVLDKINAFREAGMRFPANYSPENALKAAFLMLQDTLDRNDKPVLEVCTPASIANSLLEMVIKGLNPIKKQCYFIAYGNQLSCDESYFGKEVTAKRVGNVKEIKTATIYQDDLFVYEKDAVTGRNKIIKHEQKIENIDHEKVKGAYAIVTFNDGTVDVEIMSMKQIRSAWSMGATKGNSPAHNKFSDEMAEKTVASRACKTIINATDDADLFIEQERPDGVASNVKALVADNANKKEIGFEEEASAEVTTSSVPASDKAEVVNKSQTEMAGPGF